MLQKTQQEFSTLMQTQEAEKGYHQMPDGSMMANEDMQYPDGGKINNPLYPDLERYGSIDYSMNYIQPLPGRVMANKALNSPSIEQLQPEQYNPSSEERSFNLEPYLEAIGTYAPIAYNLGQGLFGKAQNLNASDYYNPYENQVTNLMANRKYNVNPELRSNRMAQLNYIRGLRGGAPSQSQYLANLGQSQINRSRSDADAYSRKQNIENEYQGQYAQTLAGLGQNRAATKLNIQDINDRNLATKRNFTSTGLSQLQQATQMRRLMKNLKGTENQKSKLLKELFKGYNFNLGEE
jgi:hypothetical protein